MQINDIRQLQHINNIISESLGFVIMGEDRYMALLKATMKGVQQYQIDNHFKSIKKHVEQLTENINENNKRYGI